MKIEEVPIDKITVGLRYRKESGDLESLAANIREMGLLQPIGIDSYYHLIFGARRLEACADILQWEMIPCVILNLNSVLAGEYAENEFRKQFTASERAALGKAIEEELGNRKGANLPNNPKHSVPANAGTELKGETVDIAAKRAGFKSAETFERAKTVVERGAPDLVKAMDTGEVSIAAAETISSQPKDEQKRIIAMPKEPRKEVIRQIRKTKADKEADERRARDIRLFRGLYNAVKEIAGFCEDPKETWAGLWRVSAYDFAEHLPKAIEYLMRLKKEHPNETKRPVKVS